MTEAPARQFARAAASVPEARRYVARALAGLPADVRERARLLVSELATNALLYSPGGFKVSAVYRPHDGVVRVQVTDFGDGEPRLARARATDEHGRGLQLVAAFSDHWGVDKHSGAPGKTVWFELLTNQPGRGPSQLAAP
jgi:anti-sigma regulatory factor (Ser/Thr protein kinase)